MLSPILATTPGWTLFSGVLSTVFPLVILCVILLLYTLALLRHRSG